MLAAPRYARPFVLFFVGMLVVCALAPLNLWPFSNWELFSRLRGPVEISWVAVVFAHDVRVGAFAIGGHTACDPLLRSIRERFGSAAAVRIYRVERLLSDRVRGHADPSSHSFVGTCTAKGAHAPS